MLEAVQSHLITINPTGRKYDIKLLLSSQVENRPGHIETGRIIMLFMVRGKKRTINSTCTYYIIRGAIMDFIFYCKFIPFRRRGEWNSEQTRAPQSHRCCRKIRCRVPSVVILCARERYVIADRTGKDCTLRRLHY